MDKFIRQETLTPEQARKMEKQYKLEHIAMHLDGTDTYNIYEKGGK